MSFSQTDKVGNVGNFVLLLFCCFCHTSTDVNKCEIKNQDVHENHILRSNATLDEFIFNVGAEMKLALLAFLYCGEIVKNSNTMNKTLTSTS